MVCHRLVTSLFDAIKRFFAPKRGLRNSPSSESDTVSSVKHLPQNVECLGTSESHWVAWKDFSPRNQAPWPATTTQVGRVLCGLDTRPTRMAYLPRNKSQV